MNEPSHPSIGTLLSSAGLADLSREVSGSTFQSVQRILCAVRRHLDMDVAYISEFSGNVRHFRHVDAKGASPIVVGDSLDLDQGYCRHVVEGSLPELIVDTADSPFAMSLPVTFAVPIGSHLSVPIRLKDGRVYGTFCCFNFLADRTLSSRDLGVMRAFADVAASQIESELETSAARTDKGRRIRAALDAGQPRMVYQPVHVLADLKVVGVECLARFDIAPHRGPDAWFAEATEAGQGMALELQAVRHGLRELQRRRVDRDCAVWVNVSAHTIVQGGLRDHLQGVAASRLVLELSEHEHIEDYGALLAALAPLRALGMRVAIDDVGAGYASMSHILNLEPDFIKLDLGLIQHIDLDRKRRALASALIEFGRQIKAKVVAEGVESIAELDELRRLGVHMAQGYFLSRPFAADALAALGVGSRIDH